MDLLVEQDFVIRLEVLNDYILQVKRSWTHWQQKPLWPQNKSIQKQTIHRKTTFLNMLR